MGFPYAVDSFMVLVLGGVGSLWGVLSGGALIGESETILSFIFNNVIAKLLVFLFIVIIIRVVPRGIFGYYERR
jgi:urea transport system permease protein